MDTRLDSTLMELQLREYLNAARLELTQQFDLQDPQVLRLVQALQCDIDHGCPTGSLFGEMIGGALWVYITHRCSANSPNSAPFAGGLPGPRLNRVLEYIQANLES